MGLFAGRQTLGGRRELGEGEFPLEKSQGKNCLTCARKRIQGQKKGENRELRIGGEWEKKGSKGAEDI